MRRPALSPLLLALLACLSPSCASLPALDPGTCGNGVVDPATEDCDGIGSPSGARCRPPGGPNPCRLEASAGSICPNGWTAGLDRICRRASGRFTASTSVGADARRILLGDFDGSNVKSALAVGQAQTSLFFFDAQGKLADSAAQSAQYSGAIAGRFGDATDGFAHVRAEGVGVVMGQPDRSLLRKSYPLLSFPGSGFRFVAGRVVPLTSAELAKGPTDPNGEQVMVIGPSVTTDPQNPLAHVILRANDRVLYTYLPGAPRDLVGQPARGALLDQASNCDSIALAFSPEAFDDKLPRVIVFPLCRPNKDESRSVQNTSDQNPKNDAGMRTGFTPDPNGTIAIPWVPWHDGLDGQVSIRFPPGHAPSPEAAMQLVDIDGDRILDLLLPSDLTDGSKSLLAAYGDGKGGFVSSKDPGVSAVPNTAARLIPGMASNLSKGLLRASADLDGDGKLDFVMSDGVYLSGIVGAFGVGNDLSDGGLAPDAAGGALERFASYKPARGTWKNAQIADFSANGTLDVMAAGDTDVGIDFFEGAGSGLLNRTFLPTSSFVGEMTVGDFDGDRIPDLAYGAAHSITSAASCDPGDPVSVRFGQPAAPPLLETSIGLFGCVKQLGAARVGVLGSPGRDAISALGIIYDPLPMDSPHSVAILRGDGNRELSSPYGLQLGSELVPSQPTVLAAGSFTAGGGDALAVSADPYPALDATPDQKAEHEIWLLQFAAGGDITSAEPSDPLPISPQLLTSLSLGKKGTSAVLLAVGPCSTCAQADPAMALILRPQVATTATGNPAPALRFVADPDGPHPLPAAVAPTGAAVPDQAGSADLDGDGRADVVILLGGTLFVAWNNNDVIDWANLTQLTAQHPALASIEAGHARFGSFAFLNADDDPASEIALRMVTGSDPISLLDLAGRAPQPRALTGFSGYGALAAGDVNGDGVDDLVAGYGAAAAPGRLFVYLGAPTLP